MPHIAAKVNMLIYTDVDPASVTGSQDIFFGMLRGSYVPNLVKFGAKLGSQC